MKRKQRTYLAAMIVGFAGAIVDYHAGNVAAFYIQFAVGLCCAAGFAWDDGREINT